MQISENKLKELTKNLDVPEDAETAAEERYKSLGEWLSRSESICRNHDIHVYSQGSFRLGTTIRPRKENEYDLDIVCCFNTGISPDTHTQKDLVDILYKEVGLYLEKNGVNAKLEHGNRCLCLTYPHSNNIKFHMDILPSIPANMRKVVALNESLKANFSYAADSAMKIASKFIAITDKRNDDYDELDADWLVSNPEGYAEWFEKRNIVKVVVSEQLTFDAKAKVNPLPEFQSKKPLQKIIQLLKKHRDVMFANKPESKPISIIITTLATQHYNGSATLLGTLEDIVNGLVEFAKNGTKQVPNPSNPEENFADKWSMSEYRHLYLHDNFRLWVSELQKFFNGISSKDEELIVESANTYLGSNLVNKTVIATPAFITLKEPAIRPWCDYDK